MRSSKPINILVADADVYTRSLLEVAFPEGEFNYVALETGPEAAQYLREHTPDVIVLDSALPDIDGLNLCGRLKRIGRFTTVPVIVLAPALDPRTKDAAKLARADAVIDKPISAKHFVILVRNLLDKKTSLHPTPIPPNEPPFGRLPR